MKTLLAIMLLAVTASAQLPNINVAQGTNGTITVRLGEPKGVDLPLTLTGAAVQNDHGDWVVTVSVPSNADTIVYYVYDDSMVPVGTVTVVAPSAAKVSGPIEAPTEAMLMEFGMKTTDSAGNWSGGNVTQGSTYKSTHYNFFVQYGFDYVATVAAEVKMIVYKSGVGVVSTTILSFTFNADKSEVTYTVPTAANVVVPADGSYEIEIKWWYTQRHEDLDITQEWTHDASTSGS